MKRTGRGGSSTGCSERTTSPRRRRGCCDISAGPRWRAISLRWSRRSTNGATTSSGFGAIARPADRRPPWRSFVGTDPGASASSSCGGCGTRWQFPRTKCPFCENDSQKLSVVSVEGEAGLRIDYCVSCSGYLKTYDGQGDEDLLLVGLELAASRSRRARSRAEAARRLASSRSTGRREPTPRRLAMSAARSVRRNSARTATAASTRRRIRHKRGNRGRVRERRGERPPRAGPRRPRRRSPRDSPAGPRRTGR